MKHTIEFQNVFPHLPPVVVEVEGEADHRKARSVALEALAAHGTVSRLILDNLDFLGDMRSAHFTNCLIRGSTFGEVDLSHTTFQECNLGPTESLNVLKVSPAANLTNAHFHGCNLFGASFKGANVERASFHGCNLRQADMRDLRGQGSHWMNCRSTGSDWTGADMAWSVCRSLEGLGNLMQQFKGDESDRLALSQYQVYAHTMTEAAARKASEIDREAYRKAHRPLKATIVTA